MVYSTAPSTDAEIIAQQKIDQPKRDKAEAEQRAAAAVIWVRLCCQVALCSCGGSEWPQ